VGTGTYTYDCCKKKPIIYDIAIDGSWYDDFDELFGPGLGDTFITFYGSFSHDYSGSFQP